jgi:hypothetical protein
MLKIIQKKIQIITQYGQGRIFKYAVVSNTVIGVILRGIGDGIQQSIERKQKQSELRKLAVESYKTADTLSSNSQDSAKTNQVKVTTQPYDMIRTSLCIFYYLISLFQTFIKGYFKLEFLVFFKLIIN